MPYHRFPALARAVVVLRRVAHALTSDPVIRIAVPPAACAPPVPFDPDRPADPDALDVPGVGRDERVPGETI